MAEKNNAAEWESHRWHDFVFEGGNATPVYPERAAAGTPRVWRTECFGTFPQVDLAIF